MAYNLMDDIESNDNGETEFSLEDIFVNPDDKERLEKLLKSKQIFLAYQLFYKIYTSFEKNFIKQNLTKGEKLAPKTDEELHTIFSENFSDFLFGHEGIFSRLEQTIEMYFPEIDPFEKAYLQEKFKMIYIPTSVEAFNESVLIVNAPSINELATYLKNNRHLWGIPSIISHFIQQYDGIAKTALETSVESHFKHQKESLEKEHSTTNIKVYFNKNHYCTKEKVRQYCRECITYSFIYSA
ncbi:MAG: hypothetical protein LBP53_08195 [Candidatus Peribacteria bacterium]|nr:hypothetical protein [Candidatus Peribacteria bacterium]